MSREIHSNETIIRCAYYRLNEILNDFAVAAVVKFATDNKVTDLDSVEIVLDEKDPWNVIARFKYDK